MPDAQLTPVLCVYSPANAQLETDRWMHDIPRDVDIYTAPVPSTAVQAVQACAERYPGRDVLLISTCVDLPSGWWERIVAAQGTGFGVISPLTNAVDAFNPFPSVAPVNVEDADASIFMLASNCLVPCNGWLPTCALWSSSAIASLTCAVPEGELPPGLEAALLDTLYVRSEPVLLRLDTAPAAVAARRLAVEALNGRVPTAVGRGRLPVMLHVLHGWGGGAQFFVETFVRSACQWQHLILVSAGDRTTRAVGTQLALHDDLSSPPLHVWPLSAEIGSTAIVSTEYRDILDDVISRFRVSQVLVSSLIGHSLDALRTGLPTAMVTHDYYPMWPLLHEDFSSVSEDYSASAIPAALARVPDDFPFRDVSATHWQTLREEYLRSLQSAGVHLFSPSCSVRDNLLRMAPELSRLPWALVPHGLPNWQRAVELVEPPVRKSLRVLVLGRLNGGKGEELLAELLPYLKPEVELHLLGCGRAGMRFFGIDGVHIRLDYARDDLPDLVRLIAPDLALLAPTVAETFSFTLSELFSLGLPVVATRIGSLAERIEDGRTGILVTPSAPELASVLHRFLESRDELAGLRSIKQVPDVESMISRYAQEFPAHRAARRTFPRPRWTHFGVELAAGLVRGQSLDRSLRVAQELVRTQQEELDRRGEWGGELEKKLKERTSWARSLEQLLDDERKQMANVSGELEERTRWAYQLRDELAASHVRVVELQEEVQGRTAWVRAVQAELDDAREQIKRAMDQLARERRELTDARATLVETRSRLDTAVHNLMVQEEKLQGLTASLVSAVEHGKVMEAERDAILASRSWKMTRPLRYGARLVRKAFSAVS